MSVFGGVRLQRFPDGATDQDETTGKHFDKLKDFHTRSVFYRFIIRQYVNADRCVAICYFCFIDLLVFPVCSPIVPSIAFGISHRPGQRQRRRLRARLPANGCLVIWNDGENRGKSSRWYHEYSA